MGMVKTLLRPAGFESPPQPNWHTLRFDGSCCGNGSDAATGRWAFHLTDSSGRTVGLSSGKSVARPTTNNITEYEGLLNGLAHAVELTGVDGLQIEGDSDLVVNQVACQWKAKTPHLAELRDEALDLLASFGRPWHISWIPREENEFCDSLT